jgi:hypothetical protein
LSAPESAQELKEEGEETIYAEGSGGGEGERQTVVSSREGGGGGKEEQGEIVSLWPMTSTNAEHSIVTVVIMKRSVLFYSCDPLRIGFRV